jgi:hypothetical protein
MRQVGAGTLSRIIASFRHDMPGHRAAGRPVLVALIVTVGLARICEAQNPPLNVVLDRLSAYLLQYETKVVELAADERYKQWIKRRSGYGGDTVARRDLRSTYFLIRLPDGRAWFGFRDVTRVDKRDVSRPGRPMEQILGERTASAYEEALTVMRENAKYNIGDVYRTINLPLQALDLLHPEYRDRFEFRAIGRGSAAGQEAFIIQFQERPGFGPTLVTDGFGGEVLSYGRVWVEPASGAVLRTELSFKGSATRYLRESSVRVEYQRDRRLQVLLPSEMEERYGLEIEVLHGVATYRNYRRFETGARMVTDAK